MLSLYRPVFALLMFLGLSASAFAGGNGVSPSPYVISRVPVLDLPITNSMVTSWVISLMLIFVIRAWVKTPKMIPTRGQAVVESAVEAVRGMIAPIVGKSMVKPTFPLLLCFFIYILIHNWSGLLPGVGAFGHYDDAGHFLYYFRPGNADLNMTFALSIISFAMWTYCVLRFAGVKVLFFDLFGNKANKKEVPLLAYYGLFFIFLGVGCIEVISILFRLISLSFRLYGNVFGGENLLTSITGLVGYVVPVPFYFLEVLIGVVQALVFTLLTAIYIGLICNHGDEEHA